MTHEKHLTEGPLENCIHSSRRACSYPRDMHGIGTSANTPKIDSSVQTPVAQPPSQLAQKNSNLLVVLASLALSWAALFASIAVLVVAFRWMTSQL